MSYKNLYLDIRVPLLVRGPGVDSNKVIKDVVVNIDLAPTIVEMGGRDMNSADGISFLPSLLMKESYDESTESNDIYPTHSSQLASNLRDTH